VSANTTLQALDLAQALIRCNSVTPADGGALTTLQDALEPLGFTCHRLPFSEDGAADVDNLYARLGTGAPHFCFAGHSDVVPVGNEDGWTSEPFGAELRDDALYGRGASDMKGAVACFAAAVSRFVARHGDGFAGSISMLITGDEEGPAINGTTKMLSWLTEHGEKLDVCLVGEPTNPTKLGEMVKIGRRGSMSGALTVMGVQGHTAYPHLADNPLPRLIAMLAAISMETLDDGTDHFQPSNLQLTTIDVGNTATNIIPSQATASFNIRFNDLHSGASLTKWLHEKFDAIGGDYALDVNISGEAFLTPPGDFSALLAGVIEHVTGVAPELSTSGGTSDARFIKDYCPVAEFGLVGQTMHKADERVELKDLADLTDIYEAVLEGYFATNSVGT
jgi:succinyl-diaminopimelate desuccinylase